MLIMKSIYIPVKQNDKKVNNIQVYISYFLGTNSYYNNKPRGYYAYINPVEVINHGSYSTISCCPFDSISVLLKEVKRKSKKSETEAKSILKESLQDFVEKVLSKNNLQLEENFNLSDIINNIDELEI